jgi:hypothetical protein
MNRPDSWNRSVKSELLSYSCTPLHMWIRSMEYLFNMACRLPCKDKITATSKEFMFNKGELQVRTNFLLH